MTHKVHEIIKLMMTCAASATMGGVCAIEMSAMFSWLALTIGILIGGMSGFILWDWKQVLRAIPMAWRKVAGRFPVSFWIEWFLITLAYIHFLFLFMAFMFVSGFMYYEEPFDQLFKTFLTIFSYLVICCVVLGLSIALRPKEKRVLVMFASTDAALVFMWVTFPPLLIFYHLPRTAFFLLKHLTKFAYRFLREFIILVYSQNRLICLVGGALGMLIGYLFSNVVICAIAGAVIGYISRELIAKRWLGLLPT